MNEALKVGLLGCGRAAERLHVPALERSADFDLAAVADPHGARAKAMAGGVGSCASFPSAREMLAQTPLDAMIIATPPTRHLADLELGAEAGLPTLVEKPMVVVQVMEAARRSAEEDGIEITLRGEMSAADE